MELRRQNDGILRELGHVPGSQRAPRRVEFSLVFTSEAARSQSQEPLLALGFEWEESDEAAEEGTFEAVAMKVIPPTLDAVTENEIALIECLAPLDAKVDGGGFWEDTVH